MDSKDDFYLVLPSNSSQKFYPENSTSCYTTHLPREINLQGNWLVGLIEIFIPQTIQNIQPDEAVFKFNIGVDDNGKQIFSKYYFPSGHYETLQELASEINQIRDISKHQMLKPSTKQKGYYSLIRTCDCKYNHTTVYNEKIMKIFGFENDEYREKGIFVTSKNKKEITGSRPAVLSRAIPNQLFLYTDICVPYAVGDTQASLLRIVSLNSSKYTFGTNTALQFAPVHYIPLLQHSFQTISININDAYGQNILFEFGTLTATLHFKRKK